jgi:hypothetical protein
MNDRHPDVASDHPIFVDSLAYDVNDATLLETFTTRYFSIKGGNVVIDTTYIIFSGILH